MLKKEIEKKERFEDTLLLVLKVKEGAMSQGMWVPLEPEKGKETDTLPRAIRRNWPC